MVTGKCSQRFDNKRIRTRGNSNIARIHEISLPEKLEGGNPREKYPRTYGEMRLTSEKSGCV